MAAHACRKGIAIGSEGIERSEIKNELARELRCILGEHRELWVLRNRIGGLTDSTRVLEQCLSRYVSAAKGDWA
jgi:hypothetical protein